MIKTKFRGDGTKLLKVFHFKTVDATVDSYGVR